MAAPLWEEPLGVAEFGEFIADYQSAAGDEPDSEY